VNLFHLHVAASATALEDARDRIAAEDGTWLGVRFAETTVPGAAYTELYVGDALLGLEDAAVVPVFARVIAAAQAAQP
jgi:hypothetical protein